MNWMLTWTIPEGRITEIGEFYRRAENTPMVRRRKIRNVDRRDLSFSKDSFIKASLLRTTNFSLLVMMELLWRNDETYWIREKGIRINITYGDFDVLVVDDYVKDCFSPDEALFFPIEIVDLADRSGNYYIMKILYDVECVDLELSKYMILKL